MRRLPYETVSTVFHQHALLLRSHAPHAPHSPTHPLTHSLTSPSPPSLSRLPFALHALPHWPRLHFRPILQTILPFHDHLISDLQPLLDQHLAALGRSRFHRLNFDNRVRSGALNHKRVRALRPA